MPLLGFAIKRPAMLWGVALAGLVASLIINLDMMGISWSHALGLNLWPVPGAGESGALPALKLDVSLFALFFNLVFLLVALLAIIASRSYLKKEEPNQAEYYALLFFALVGMMLVAAATDLLVLYLAFEVSSLSTFTLVAFRKRDKRATEASLKFFVIGAVSSALILFGISLIYVIAGALTVRAPGIAPGDPCRLFVQALPPGSALTSLAGLKTFVTSDCVSSAGLQPPFIVALVLLFAGFGFKVATVPFHQWAPDVYEGSPTTVSAFLAAGSKKVGVAAMFKGFLVGLLAAQVNWLFAVAVLAIVTQTVGDILAMPQGGIKRMLAYSSIVQAGSSLVPLRGCRPTVPPHASIPGGNPWFLWLAVAGVLNSALSLYYYARVIRYMYILEPGDARKVDAPTSMNVGIAIALIGIIVTGIIADPLIRYMQAAAAGLL